jgi:hypothetical protein
MKEIDEYLIEQFKTDKYAKTKNKESGLNPYIQFEHFTMADGTIILAGDLTRFLGQGHAVLDDPAKGSVYYFLLPPGNITKKDFRKKNFRSKTGIIFCAQMGRQISIIYRPESNVNTALDCGKNSRLQFKWKYCNGCGDNRKRRITRRIFNPDAAGFYFSPTWPKESMITRYYWV